MIDMSLPVAGGSGVALLHQCQGDITDTTSGENLLIARPPNEHTREPHSQPRTPLRRIWLITLSNTNPIELQGIVGNKTLHTLATYRRLCLYHTPLNNMGISLSSVIVIIQGEFSVFRKKWLSTFKHRGRNHGTDCTWCGKKLQVHRKFQKKKRKQRTNATGTTKKAKAM